MNCFRKLKEVELGETPIAIFIKLETQYLLQACDQLPGSCSAKSKTMLVDENVCALSDIGRMELEKM